MLYLEDAFCSVDISHDTLLALVDVCLQDLPSGAPARALPTSCLCCIGGCHVHARPPHCEASVSWLACHWAAARRATSLCSLPWSTSRLQVHCCAWEESQGRDFNALLCLFGLHGVRGGHWLGRADARRVHLCLVGLHARVLKRSFCVCSGFTACEVGAGSGGLTRDVFGMLDADNHCELLQYTATDISAAWAQRLKDRIAKPSFQFKVRA